MIELFGKPRDLPYDMTANQAADLIVREYPDYWRRVYTKHYDAPGNYHSFKAPAVSMCAATIQRVLESKRVLDGFYPVNTSLAIGCLERCDFPTYYVGKHLFEAMRHTHPQKDRTWDQITFGYPGMIFMLPDGALQTPEGEPVIYLAVTRIEAGKILRLGITGEQSPACDQSRIVMFWSAHRSCLVAQDFTFKTENELSIDPAWIEEQNAIIRDTYTAYDQKLGERLSAGQDANFSRYMAGLAANLLLIQSARPEYIERGEITGRRLPKSGLPIYRPTFLGRKYQIIRERVSGAPTGAHFTELRWRSGHWRTQHFGPKNEQMKEILIDPYIAHSAGLVRMAAAG